MASIDQEIKSSFDTEKERALINIMFTANWFKNLNNEVLHPYGVSPAQYNILRILRGAKDKMSMQNVKKRMIDKSPNTTRLTDKLFDKEFIERERCTKDRRVVYVSITKEGLSLLKEIDSPTKELMNSFDPLSEEESKTLSMLLDKLRD